MLKKSKYAFFINKEDGHYIVYSSLSGAVILFDDETYITRLKNIVQNDIISDEDEDEVITLLKSKMLLIDEKTDENLLLRTVYEESIVRSTNALEIMLIVTKQCNFRCTYCGQPHENKIMSWATYSGVLMFIRNEVAKHKYQKVKITFFGGEPLLEIQNILAFLEKVKELSKELSIEYEAGMSTNGYLLTPQNYDALSSLNCTKYQISVDGMAYTHDRTRPLASGGETWERIINNLKYMITTPDYFSVTLRTNFNMDVAESMIEFYKFVQDHINDKRIHIYFETIKDQGNKDTPRILNAIEGMMLNIDLTEIVREHGLDCINTTIRTKPCSMICYASKPNFFIFDEDRKIKKCSYDLNAEDNIIGELDDNGVAHIAFERYGRWAYSDYLLLDNCRKCKALPLCLGKRCPRNLVIAGKRMMCNVDLVESEIEGMISAYYS